MGGKDFSRVSVVEIRYSVEYACKTECLGLTVWAFPLQNQGSMDTMNMDTVCRLYEVGRQRLAEDEEDEEEDQVRSMALTRLLKSSYYASM